MGVIEMEKDCQRGDSQVLMRQGLSVRLDSLKSSQNEILGWDEKQNGLVRASHTHFMNRGERECVELVFSDGRKIVCTPNHRILKADNTWVEAKDIELNKTEVQASVTYASANFDEEIKECNGWSLQVGTRVFKTNTLGEYMKTLTFARILGYILTDGSLSVSLGNYASGCILLGHPIDVELVLSELKLLGLECKYVNDRNLFRINLPSQFVKDILTLQGVIRGRRVSQPGTWPAFITDEHCPRPIVREFLGGIFGGDGHTCSLLKRRGKYDNVTSIAFSQSKYEDHVESLKAMMQQLQKLLKKCGIEGTTIQEPKQTTHSKNRQDEINSESDDQKSNGNSSRPAKCFELTLRINNEEIINFHDKVGFRYCCHKSQRLSAAVCYIRLREETIRQRLCMVKRAVELNETMTKPKAIEKAFNELSLSEIIVHPYAIPTQSNIKDYINSAVKSDTVKLTSKSKTGENDRVFPSAEQFFTEMGVLEWFTEDDAAVCYGVNRNCSALPTMKLRVVGRRPVGKQRVYDITVEGINNFVANGIVSHNCILSHGAAEFLKETLQDRSDNYCMHTCKLCGLVSAVNKEAGIYMCKNCNNTTKFAEVRIPYAMKLFMQELETMSVAPRIITKED
jgi:intein/homing endonuclease/ribosomal protein L37AE/L43A